MSIEKPSWTNKEGWQQGDDAEKEVGPTETARTRLLYRMNRVIQGQSNRPLESNESAQLVFCSYLLDHPHGEIYESFKVDSKGFLEPESETEIPSIFAWAQTSESPIGYTAEDIRLAARNLEATFPEVNFHFSENRKDHLFEYKATLRN